MIDSEMLDDMLNPMTLIMGEIKEYQQFYGMRPEKISCHPLFFDRILMRLIFEEIVTHEVADKITWIDVNGVRLISSPMLVKFQVMYGVG